MKEIPIIFSGEMVKAILDGRKSQTRRVIKPQPTEGGLELRTACGGEFSAWQDPLLNLDEFSDDGGPCQRICPYGLPSDRLWVRETWQYYNWTEDGDPIIRYAADDERKLIYGPPEEWWDRLEQEFISLSDPENYDKEGRACDHRWRPSIHMPKWAARTWLEIVDIGVERIQDISGEDVLREGVNSYVHKDADYFEASQRDCFKRLWDSINAKRGFGMDNNPWIWVIEFRVSEKPNN